MPNRTLAIDVWHTTTLTLIDRTVAGILDTCELGLPDRHPPRDPSIRERDGTDRPDGNFHPTPIGAPIRADVSRPTERAVLTREQQWQQAAGMLYKIAAEWGRVRHPADPEVTISDTGRTLLDADMRACRIMVIVLSDWLHALTSRLTAEMRRHEGEAYEHWRDRGNELARNLETCRRRWAPDRRSVQACIREGCWRPRYKAGICHNCYHQPRPCLCGCGGTTVRGEGGTSAACRQRKSRAAKRENAA